MPVRLPGKPVSLVDRLIDLRSPGLRKAIAIPPSLLPMESADRHRSAIANYKAMRQELEALPQAKLYALIEGEQLAQAQRRAEEAAERDAAMIYNRPNAFADLTFWSKADFWTLEEAVALTLGRNPEVVNLSALKDFHNLPGVPRDYWQLYQLAMRAQAVGKLGKPAISPLMFIEWVRRNGYQPPPALIAGVETAAIRPPDWQSRAEAAERRVTELEAVVEALRAETAETKPERSVHPRERSSMLKLILGMAVSW